MDTGKDTWKCAQLRLKEDNTEEEKTIKELINLIENIKHYNKHNPDSKKDIAEKVYFNNSEKDILIVHFLTSLRFLKTD